MSQTIAWLRNLLMAAALATALPVNAQTCGGGMIGPRAIKSYWIEADRALVIQPTSPFNNPCGCNRSDQVFIPTTNPGYKAILAGVIHAMATGTPIYGFTASCYTYWGGVSWPEVWALGVGGGPN